MNIFGVCELLPALHTVLVIVTLSEHLLALHTALSDPLHRVNISCVCEHERPAFRFIPVLVFKHWLLQFIVLNITAL